MNNKKILGKRKVKSAIEILKVHGIGILPTDTIYGIVGSAVSKKAVLKIYKLRKRNNKKPMIILIGSLNDLDLFKINVNRKIRSVLNKFWPGKVSIILPCPYKKFFYLHRGVNSLAFRLPKPKWLRDILKQTGPLVAPSANFEGSEPVKTIKEAKKYFEDGVDFYLSNGKLTSRPSTLIAVKEGQVNVLRKGAVNI